MSKHTLEQYDIAFSRDPSDPSAPEVALLVVERQDLPAFSGHPHKALLVAGSAEHGTDDLRRLRVLFQDRAGPPRADSDDMFELSLDLPMAVYEMLLPFPELWFCQLDEGKVVSEHKINVYQQDA